MKLILVLLILGGSTAADTSGYDPHPVFDQKNHGFDFTLLREETYAGLKVSI